MAKINTVQDFVEGFVKNTLGNHRAHGGYYVEHAVGMDVLKFRSSSPKVENKYDAATGTYEKISTPKMETIAARMADGSSLVNANRLEYAGRQAWGYANPSHRDGRLDCQVWAEMAGAIPIAFTIFNDVPGASVLDFSWVVKPVTGGETITIYDMDKGTRDNDGKMTYPLVQRHFTGACIFDLKSEHFLFDIDRQELANYRMTPFVVKLPRRVGSVEDAYDSLIPDAIRDATARGVEVKRQGEFFFVFHSMEVPKQENFVRPELSNDEKEVMKYPPSRYGFGIGSGGRGYAYSRDSEPFPEPDLVKNDDLDDARAEFQKAALRYAEVSEKKLAMEESIASSEPRPGSIQKDGGNSHRVSKYVRIGNMQYVSGTVSHTRNEHSNLDLNGWWMVYPNTAVKSFVINGDID